MRRRAVIFFILIGLTVWAPEEILSMDLAQFQWKNRLLFIFAQDVSHPLFKGLQSQIAAQKAEVEERDLIVFEVPAQGPARMNTNPLDQQEADSIRNHFAVPSNAFSLILVGKDGGIKLKRSDQVDLSEVFGLIDSMPMRQREMRQKSQ
ncbi:MAG: DUF4174 domain-containing protein [Desulfobacterales bacterium]|jgi:hypothetical protein